jgi:hypothetical protein
MRTLNPDEMRAWLRAEQVSPAQIENIVDAFDFGAPVYETTLESGQELFQYLRKPSSSAPWPKVGNWFCLPGATRDGLAIIGGGSGRVLQRHVVALELQAIEGSARAQPVDWGWDGGGAGGATQIYVPQRLLGRISSTGPHEPW